MSKLKKRYLFVLIATLVACAAALLFINLPSDARADDDGSTAVSTYDDLVDALEDESYQTITLEEDITTSEIITIERSVTIEGGGHTLSSSSAKSVIEVSGSDITVTLTDITLTNTYSTLDSTGIYDTGRAVTVNLEGGAVTLNVEGSTLTATGGNSGVGSSIFIGGNGNTYRATVNVCGSTLSATGGHPVRIYAPADVRVEDSTLSGWSIAYFQGTNGATANGSTLTLIDSDLTSTGLSGSGNDFGVFASAYNVAIAVDGCELSYESVSENPQTFLYLDYYATAVEVSVTNTKITAEGYDASLIYACSSHITDEATSLQFGLGVTANFDISSYLADGVSYTENDGTYATNTDGAIVTTTSKDAYKYYAGLQAAITCAAAGSTVRLSYDTSISQVVVAQWQELTLDLNGNTLGEGSAANSLIAALAEEADFLIVNYGKLTIENGTVAGDNVIYNCGTLTVENATIEAEEGTALHAAAGSVTTLSSSSVIGGVERESGEGNVASITADATAFDEDVDVSLILDAGTYAASIGSTTYATLAGAIEAAEAGQTVTLIGDVTENITVGKSITLDLNGYVLSGVGYGSVITVPGRVTLTVTDGNSAAAHCFTVDGETGLYTLCGVCADPVNCECGDTCVIIYGGVITGGKGTFTTCDEKNYTIGGAVFMNSSSGAFVMYGGNIVGNQSAYGGAVFFNGTFEMYGGSIVGNTAIVQDGRGGVGGGVYINSSSSRFYMYGGTIEGNTAQTNGAGVYVNNQGAAFEMYDGKIADGIYNHSGSIAIYGGYVTGVIGCNLSNTPTTIIMGGTFGCDVDIDDYIQTGYTKIKDEVNKICVVTVVYASEKATAQANARTYMAINGWSWAYINSLAADSDSRLQVGAQAVVEAYDTIYAATTEYGVAEALLATMDKVDALAAAFGVLKEEAIETLNEYATSAATFGESVSIEGMVPMSVTVPTNLYLAIYSATTEEELALYLASAIAEVRLIKTYVAELYAQTDILESLQSTLGGLEDILSLGDSDHDTLLAAISAAITKAQNAITGATEGDEATSTSLAEIKAYIEDVVTEAETAVNDIVDQFGSALESIAEALESIGDNTEDITSIKTQIKSLQKSLAALTAGDGGTYSLADIIEAIGSVGTTVEGAQAALEKSVAALTTSLNGKIQDLQSALNAALESATEDIATQISAAQASLNGLIASIADLAEEDDITALASSIEDILTELSAIEGTVEGIVESGVTSAELQNTVDNVEIAVAVMAGVLTLIALLLIVCLVVLIIKRKSRKE